MGSPAGEWGRGANEEPQRTISITRPFYMARGEVTNQEFKTFIDATKYNPVPLAESDFQFLYYLTGAGKAKYDSTPTNAPDHAVIWVSWYSACRFCNWLSEKEGLPPVYVFTESKEKGLPPAVAMARPYDGGYRLPTEAEWEYAARAGTTTAFSFGPDDKKFAEYAHYGMLPPYNDPNYRHPVLSGKPNPWGLHQMHGNAFEWCWDFYAKRYDPNQLADPLGPPQGRLRVERGGTGRLPPMYARSAARLMDVPAMTRYDLGFRLVRNVGRSQPTP
jgi:formylglycine-generating enzyme required for sulfatase activity